MFLALIVAGVPVLACLFIFRWRHCFSRLVLATMLFFLASLLSISSSVLLALPAVAGVSDVARPSVLLVAPLLLEAFPAIAGIPCCCLRSLLLLAFPAVAGIPCRCWHSLPLLAFLAVAEVSDVTNVFSIPRFLLVLLAF